MHFSNHCMHAPYTVMCHDPLNAVETEKVSSETQMCFNVRQNKLDELGKANIETTPKWLRKKSKKLDCGRLLVMGYLKGYFVVTYLHFSHVIERMLLGRLRIRESCMNQIGPFYFQKSMEEMSY